MRQDTLQPAMLSPSEIVARIDSWGRVKAGLPLNKLMVLGILAGAFIAIGATFCLLVITNSTLGFGPTRLLGGVVFSLGLMLVILTGAELSTGNCLLIVPWATHQLSTPALLRNWGLSFVANGVGALLFVVLVAKSGLLDPGDFQQTAKRVAESKLALDPVPAFVRGVLCNMLVCLAVWMSFAATTAPGKLFAVITPIAAFVALGFEHSVANVFLLPLGMIAGADGTLAMFATNIVMVTLGNLVGGAAIGWALGCMHARAAETSMVDRYPISGSGAWRHRFAATTTFAVAGWLLFSPHQMTAVVIAEASSPPVGTAALSINHLVDVPAQLKRIEDRHAASELAAKRIYLVIEELVSETAKLKTAAVKAATGDQTPGSIQEPRAPKDQGTRRPTQQRSGIRQPTRACPP